MKSLGPFWECFGYIGDYTQVYGDYVGLSMIIINHFKDPYYYWGIIGDNKYAIVKGFNWAFREYNTLPPFCNINVYLH